MNKYFEIAKKVYVTGLILIPLIISPFSLTPYTLAKTFSLALLVLVCFIFLILSKPNRLLFPSWVLVLLILFEILSIKGIDSLWFLFPRYSESVLISILIYFFVFIGKNLFKNLDIDKIIIYSSSLVLVISILDLMNFNSRISSTLGQANFLGIFLVLGLLSLISNHENFKTYNKYFLFFYILLSLIFIIKSASITSLICLIFGLIILRKNLVQINRKVLLLFSVGLVLMFLLFGNIFLAKIQDIYNQINKPKETIITDSFLIRTKVWSQTLNLIYNNPISLILGNGAGNFEYHFEKNRDDILENLSEKNLLFDKPHNYLIEILFNYGVFYLALFLYCIYLSIKNRKNNYLVIPLTLFMLFNWLDIYLKLIFFSLIASSLKDSEIKNSKIFEVISTTSLLLIFLFFSILLFKDTSFYLGNPKYIYSISKESVVELKTKSPVILISSIEFLNENEKREIFDFLIKNFPNNRAILFQLNKLF